MLIEEDDATELKKWTVKRLEDISDADSDVLADYVLALIRTDTPETQLRLDVIQSLEDFLKENTTAFVEEVLLAIQTKSYQPGYVPPPTAPSAPNSYAGSAEPARVYDPLGRGRGANPGFQASRKRSYNDRQENENGVDSHYARSGRQMKQMRRGGRVGRGDDFGSRHAGGPFLQSPHVQPGSPPVPSSFLNMPQMPPGMPSFDPNDPMAAILAMQAMGLPPIPGMPTYPQAGSPNGQPHFGGQGLPGVNGGRRDTRQRCRDYDNKGYCTRGDACPYLHGTDRVVVPGQDEYDPKNAVLMDISPVSPVPNGHNASNESRGHGHIRGSGRGRGDRGGFMPRRNRAEFSQAGPNHDRSITTIVVEQIPEEKFNEQSVQDFFSEFGNVEEITMQPYKRLALVKYDDYKAAKNAYDSPKVIFDNRFVKVYWYKPNSVPIPPTAAKGDAGSPVTSTAEEQPFDREKFEQDSQAAQKKLEEKKAQMKEMEAKREALEKQKQELAAKQAEEKRKLLQKLAARSGTSNVDTSMVDSKANGTDGDDNTASAHTKALRAKVAELEAEAKSLGLDSALSDSTSSPRGRGRGRGGRGSYRGWEGFAGRAAYDPSYRGSPRGRGGSFRGQGGGKYNLDNRTRKVGVSGVEFDSEKDEALRQYLIGIGDYEAISPHPSNPSTQIITFKDRPTAESFMYGSKTIPGAGDVEYSWFNTPLPPAQLPVKAPASDGDVGMTGVVEEGDKNGGASAGGGGGGGAGGGPEVLDYDVAEEDDRWMAE